MRSQSPPASWVPRLSVPGNSSGSNSAAMAEAVHRQKQLDQAQRSGSSGTLQPGQVAAVAAANGVSSSNGNMQQSASAGSTHFGGSLTVATATTNADLLSSRSDGSWYSGVTASDSGGDPVVQKLLDQPLLLGGCTNAIEALNRQPAVVAAAGGLSQMAITGSNIQVARKFDRSARPPPAGPDPGNKKSQYHRTKLCPWHREGKCFMREACNYAHSREELRPKPDLSKTKLCPELVKGKPCTRQGCRFAHDFVELRATSAFFKTRICKYWQRGYCPAGYECRHAHGREDLRSSPNAQDHLLAVGGLVDDKSQMWNWQQNPSAVTALPFGPPASSLPSPSFLSTSTSTPNSNKTPTASLSGPPSAVTLEQCVALLAQQQPPPPPSSPANTSQQEAFEQLKLWIAQEVERQVVSRTGGSGVGNARISSALFASATGNVPAVCSPPIEPRTPRPDLPETAMLLPQDVLQNLNNSATPVSGLNAAFSWAATGESPTSFAAAVKSLQGAVAGGFPEAPVAQPCDLDQAASRLLGEATPTQVLLRALGGMTADESGSGGATPEGVRFPSVGPDSISPSLPRLGRKFAA